MLMYVQKNGDMACQGSLNLFGLEEAQIPLKRCRKECFPAFVRDAVSKRKPGITLGEKVLFSGN